MKTVFFGTPSFAVPFLQAMIDDPEIEVVAVVSQPDKPKGRKQKLQPTATKVVAQEHSIPVLQFPSLKKDEVVAELSALDADVFVVVAYGKLIPLNVINIPEEKIVNVHPSLLPRHRGPSPMQWSIAEGDQNTGVSIMLIDEGMDTGPLLAQESFDVDVHETYQTLEVRVHEVGAPLLIKTLKAYVAGDLTPTPQSEESVSLTRLLKREDGHISWTDSAERIERLVRAYQPWPGTWSLLPDGQRLKILRATPLELTVDVPPGTLFEHNETLCVASENGAVQLDEVQLEGKQKTTGREFLLGHPDVLQQVLT